MERRKFLTALGTTGIGVTVSGCIGGDDENGDPENGDADDGETDADDDGDAEGEVEMPDPYRVGCNGPSAPVWEYPAFPLFGSRLDEEHGGEAERTAFMGFTDVVSGVVSEEAEICYLSLQALINARAQDVPIIAFLGNANEYNFPIVISEEIGGWDDLEGETVAIQDTSAVSYASTRAMVNEELGDPDAVEYQVMAGTENRLAAIESGEIDAAAVFTSGAFAAESEGFATILGYPWDYEVTRDQTALVWATLEPKLQEENDMLATTAEYLNDAQSEVYEEDPETLVDQALDTGVYAEFGEDIWLDSFDVARENELWAEDGQIEDEQVERGQDLLESAGLLDEEDRVERDDIVTDEFM